MRILRYAVVLFILAAVRFIYDFFAHAPFFDVTFIGTSAGLLVGLVLADMMMFRNSKRQKSKTKKQTKRH